MSMNIHTVPKCWSGKPPAGNSPAGSRQYRLCLLLAGALIRLDAGSEIGGSSRNDFVLFLAKFSAKQKNK